MEKKKYPPPFLHILVFIFWNSKIGKVGQNGPKNSFEKVILKCFFKKRQKIMFFIFAYFCVFVGSRRQLSKGKSFLQKSEKLFQREWRLKMVLFAEKNMFFRITFCIGQTIRLVLRWKIYAVSRPHLCYGTHWWQKR